MYIMHEINIEPRNHYHLRKFICYKLLSQYIQRISISNIYPSVLLKHVALVDGGAQCRWQQAGNEQQVSHHHDDSTRATNPLCVCLSHMQPCMHVDRVSHALCLCHNNYATAAEWKQTQRVRCLILMDGSQCTVQPKQAGSKYRCVIVL